MIDGLFELVFILLIVVASIVDAVSRSRKKRQRMEEMEQEDQGGSTAAAESEEAPYREPEPVSSSPEPATATSDSAAGGEEEGERETADRMVPEDFWAILTGQAPPDGPTEGEVGQPEGTLAGGAGERDAGGRTGRDPTRATERELPEQPVRRSDPDPSGSPHIPVPVPQDRYRSEPERPWETETGSPGGSFPHRGLSRRAERERDARREARRMPALQPRRSRSTRYTELLKSGDVEELRSAIVLREVLGPPAALRPPADAWSDQGTKRAPDR